jgi:hypothetical protein
MTLFVSMPDVACVLHTTVADPLHVIRPRAAAGGRGPDLLALDGLLTWLNAAMGHGLSPEIASDLARRAQTEFEFDGVEVRP